MTEPPPHFPTSITIPIDWTPEQALAVFVILGEIHQQIWEKYEADLLQHLPPYYDRQSVQAVDIDEKDIPY